MLVQYSAVCKICACRGCANALHIPFCSDDITVDEPDMLWPNQHLATPVQQQSSYTPISIRTMLTHHPSPARQACASVPCMQSLAKHWKLSLMCNFRPWMCAWRCWSRGRQGRIMPALALTHPQATMSWTCTSRRPLCRYGKLRCMCVRLLAGCLPVLSVQCSTCGVNVQQPEAPEAPEAASLHLLCVASQQRVRPLLC